MNWKVATAASCLLLLSSAQAGIKCSLDELGPLNPELVKARPVMLRDPGGGPVLDLSPEVVTQIIDAQTPEFLVSRIQGRTFKRLTPGKPTT
jgi:hypothetical protein